MTNLPNPTRRTLLRGIAVVPLAGVLLPTRIAFAITLEETDTQAAALGYKKVSTVEGKNCANCKLWKGGTAEMGACTLFPGKDVARGGHCNSWVALA